MTRETSGIADRKTAWQAQQMRTGWAIIIAAVIIATTGAVTAWTITPRYSLTNPGGGVTIRLDRSSGDMVGCERMACRKIVQGDSMLSKWWDAAEPVPAAPPGYTLQNAQ